MGLETGRAVKVDSHMATNLPDIYACGDCAEYEGTNYAIWPEASEQGASPEPTAAGEALGVRAGGGRAHIPRHEHRPLCGRGQRKESESPVQTVEFRDMGKEQYRKYFFLNNRLSGVIPHRGPGQMAELSEALKKHASYKDVIG